jgi:hypothetical protein
MERVAVVARGTYSRMELEWSKRAREEVRDRHESPTRRRRRRPYFEIQPKNSVMDRLKKSFAFAFIYLIGFAYLTEKRLGAVGQEKGHGDASTRILELCRQDGSLVAAD